MSEQVFIVPYDKTNDIPHGFTRQKHYKQIWNKYNDVGLYVDKEVAESTPSMQQIMPYVIIRSKEGKYLTSHFVKENTNVISIGFGDHIIPIDGVREPLFKGACRSLFNELTLNEYKSLSYVGTVKDMENNNNHIGYVLKMDDLEENIVKLINENDSYFGKWMSLDELINSYGNLGYWSKHIVNYLVDNSF